MQNSLNLEIPFEPGCELAISFRRQNDRFHYNTRTRQFQQDAPPDADRLIPLGEATAAASAAGSPPGIDQGLYRLSFPGTASWWNVSLVAALHVLANPAWDPTPPVPRTHTTFEIAFANGGAVYNAPPFLAY